MFDSATPQTAVHHAPLPFTIFQGFLKSMPIESVMLFNHLIICCPLLLLASIFPSIKVFSNESALFIRWPKYWSFSFSISPSYVYLGLISFRIDWLQTITVQGTLKNFLQHCNSKKFFSTHPSFLKKLINLSLNKTKIHIFNDKRYNSQKG